MCSTGLGYGGQRTRDAYESAIVVMANMANTGKTVQVVYLLVYGDRVERGESCKPRLNPRPEK